ncbi:helix-turn-helix transcriptional regulator [Nakamurella sp. A5-74]|uniref:Helix-turn-helix transcriptional regulator n=1 Tax=Nakamurella sp. A5-74 TaxID=3158264 RepID=A0AAU8DV46_9ACTN
MPTRRAVEQAARAAEHLGNRVREYREAHGLTQEQLAERAGISRNQVQNIEHSRNNSRDADGRQGSGNPRLDTVFALADALNIEVSELLGDVARH